MSPQFKELYSIDLYTQVKMHIKNWGAISSNGAPGHGSGSVKLTHYRDQIWWAWNGLLPFPTALGACWSCRRSIQAPLTNFANRPKRLGKCRLGGAQVRVSLFSGACLGDSDSG